MLTVQHLNIGGPWWTRGNWQHNLKLARLPLGAEQSAAVTACSPYHECNQAANTVTNKDSGLLNKLLCEVQHLVAPQLHAVVQLRFLRVTKSQQIDGINLRSGA